MVSVESLDIESVGPPPRPRVVFEPFVVRVFETRTGRVAYVVPYVGLPTWNRGVNQVGAWRVTIPIAEIGKDNLEGLINPWRFSWAICQGSKIWQAGPVVSEDYSGGPNTTVVGSGLWQLFTAKRLVLNPARATLAGISQADADVAFGPTDTSPVGSVIPVANQNLSLHTIAKRLVQTVTGAAGGNVPLVYPADIAGTAERTYPGYEMAPLGQRLFELTQVIDGPELEFAPSFTDETGKQSVQWVMRIGNSRLGNLTFPHAWDFGKAMIDINRSNDGGEFSTRDFERGNGMNRDLVSGFYDAPIGGDSAAMLLENVGQEHTQSTNLAELNGFAQAAVLSSSLSTSNYTATVRIPGDDGEGYATGSPQLSSVDVGDNCTAQIRGHARLVDGEYGFRIAAISSGQRPQEAVLSLQYLGRNT